MNNKILFIEDDKNLGYILSEYLQLNGFLVAWAKDGKEGLDWLGKNSCDLCILDIMLPNADGFSIAEQIRKDNKQIPLIFLTAKSLKIDKLRGFRIGCDDYITKPVDEEELIARIQAVLKRSRPAEGMVVIKIGQTVFDGNLQRILFAGEEKQLTNKEAEVLTFLARNKNNITERDMMLKKIWGSNDFFNRRSMDVIISRLRKHLQKDPSLAIKNIHGKGYILKEMN